MKHIRSLILAFALSAGLAPAFAQAPPPVPALPDTERRTSYVISASTCACAVGFQLYQDSTDYANWLTVYINGVQIPQSGNWTLSVPTGSLASNPRPITNAVLTFNSPQTGTVQIVGAQRPRRLSEYAENRGVAARDLNQAINGIEAQLREMWDRQFRTVQAPPGETLSVLPPQSGRANMGACFDSSGNLAPCLGAGSGTFIAGNGVNFTGTGPTTISVATYSAGNGINFTGTNPTVISVSASSGTPVIPTRTAAAALDLSAYSVIMTGGYSTAGDGGGGTFKNVGSAPFIDSFITTFTITGGSGYTNGSYYGNIFTVGTKPYAVGTVTVSGGAFTGVNIAGTPGLQCAVGDVLAFSGSAAATSSPANGMPAGGSGASITVTGCSAPLASFTDTAGNHWQFVPNTFPNVLQFGAKGDWNGVDATATDNFNAIQAAAWFASNKSSTSFDAGGYWGGRVNVPSGSYKMCGSTYFVLPNNVIFDGASSAAASNFHLCDAYSTSTNAFEICDPNWHFACFGSRFQNMSFHASRSVSVTGGVSMIHSNAVQDMGGVYNTYVYSGHRIAIHFEKGFGGASWVGIHNVSISQSSSNNVMLKIGNTPGSGLTYGSTIVSIENIILGGTSSAPYQLTGGLQILGGFVNVKNLHCEIITDWCVSVAIPVGANGEQVDLHSINSQGCASTLSGSGSCRGVIELDGTNNLGNTKITTVPISPSHTHVISNGQAGGVSYDTAIRSQLICTTTCHTEVIP